MNPVRNSFSRGYSEGSNGVKILAIDTSTNFLCLGIADGKRLYEYSLELGRRLSALLVPTLKRALEALGWRLQDIDCFACGLGPGSFTGLRIGLAAVKAMAWALDRPLLGISSLDILAAGAGQRKQRINVINDAGRGLVYCSSYKNSGGKLRRITPYALLDEKGLLGALKSKSIIIGSGAALYREKILDKVKGALILDKDYWRLRPRQIITLAEERIKEKKRESIFGIKPLYLYAKECQIRK